MLDQDIPPHIQVYPPFCCMVVCTICQDSLSYCEGRITTQYRSAGAAVVIEVNCTTVDLKTVRNTENPGYIS